MSENRIDTYNPPVYGLFELRQLARCKASVRVERWRGSAVHPAAFLLNWNACVLDDLLRAGRIHRYIPEKKFDVTQDTREWVEAVTR